MKRFRRYFMMLLFILLCATALGAFSFPDAKPSIAKDDPEFSYFANGKEYIFCNRGGGLKEVKTITGDTIYDFGPRPAWFMLKYMYQSFEGEEVRTEAKYYYPQLDYVHPTTEENFIGCYIDPGTIQGFSENLPPGVLYLYEFIEPEHQGVEPTRVGIYFAISESANFYGVMIYSTVFNSALDNSSERYRLMEVHCPFVRLPKIGSYSTDDVITESNYLIENPIETYNYAAEPYKMKNAIEYDTRDSFYPKGFQVRAYYDTGEHPGRGIYMATYNLQRETAQNNLYKHQGDYTNWEWIGPNRNQPPLYFRNYLIWDVVRYTRNINTIQNDFATDLLDLGPSWSFCAFMQFYEEGLDWYSAAEKYRKTYEYLDQSNVKELLPTNHPLQFADLSNNLWPDVAAKYNPRIPEWAKKQPLYLYISPQHPNSRHELGPALLNRIRDWQTRLQDELEVYEGFNNLMCSTWIVDWADDVERGNIQQYVNYPEWAGGKIPCDSILSDPGGTLDYQQKFFRSNLHNFRNQLHVPNPSVVKLITGVHGYLFNEPVESTRRYIDMNHKLTDDYRLISWPYFDDPSSGRMPKVTGHWKGFNNEPPNEMNFLWGGQIPQRGQIPAGTNDPVPQRKRGNWELNHASWDGMDYLIGSFNTPHPGQEANDLQFGMLDAQLEAAPRCIDADGTYQGFGGSVPFYPIYEGYRNLGQTEQSLLRHFSSYDTFIRPGGGTMPYKSTLAVFDYLDTQQDFSEKIVVNEGLGECFLEQYDIVVDDHWPGGVFADPINVGFTKFGQGLTVQSNEKSELLPVTWIPMSQTISHDLVLTQGGLNALAPGLHWHSYLPEYIPDSAMRFLWTFYGGDNRHTGDLIGTPVLDRGWQAFKADLANGYTFGSKLLLFDVDCGLKPDGTINADPGNDDTIDFWNTHHAKTTWKATDLLANCIKSYKYNGFPSTTDKVAEHLFFGKMLKTPRFTSWLAPEFYQNIRHDLATSMTDKVGDAYEPMNFELRTPVIMNSLWKANLAERADAPKIQRLGFVFCNFSNTGYKVHTEAIDITKLFDVEGITSYKWYEYSNSPTFLLDINNPTEFRVKPMVHPNNVKIIGVVPISGIVPPNGPYALIDNDENLDLIQLNDGIVSVVFGDGSMEYPKEKAIIVIDGVKDLSFTKLSSKKTFDLVCLTKTGFEIIKCSDTSSFVTIVSSDNLFTDAEKIVSVIETDSKFIVQDGSSLNQLEIKTSAKGKNTDSYIIEIEPVVCEPVRTFEVKNICSDDTIDLVTISDMGNIELLSWVEETPESMMVIEINTSADHITFDDVDEDGDLDILLENSAKNGRPEVLTYVDGWKFTQ